MKVWRVYFRCYRSNDQEIEEMKNEFKEAVEGRGYGKVIGVTDTIDEFRGVRKIVKFFVDVEVTDRTRLIGLTNNFNVEQMEELN